MEFNTVVDGIRYFYEIIVPKACFSSDWNVESIVDAFQWVKFCEEAYAKCTGENATNIDSLLHSLNGNLKNLYQNTLCFQDLKSCSSLLTQAFFDNPNVDDDIVKNLLQEDNLNASIISENLEGAAALSTLCYELVESLKPLSLHNSEKSFYYEIKSEIFIDYLKNILKYLQTGDVESQLKSAFEGLCTSEENMIVLLHLLLLRTKDGDEKTEEIQQFGMNWLLLKIYNNKHFPFVNFVFSQPVSKLRTLSSKYVNFFAYYVETLTQCVNDLKESGCDLKFENRKFSSNDLIISFDEVVNHFHCLTEQEDDINKSIQEHISLLLNSNPGSLVWREIAKQILK